jgi:hypothetical protein
MLTCKFTNLLANLDLRGHSIRVNDFDGASVILLVHLSLIISTTLEVGFGVGFER